MALKIQIRPKHKIIINGAVLENVSSRSASFILHNKASVLKDADIIVADEAVTPATRIYFSVQCMYLFPDDGEDRLPILNQLVQDYLEAAPSSLEIISRLKAHIAVGEFYQALRAARELINHEGVILSHGRQNSDLSEPSSGGVVTGD